MQVIPVFGFKLFHNIPIPELRGYAHSHVILRQCLTAGLLSITCDPVVGKF